MKAVRGFTLVELVAVIVVLAVLGTGTFAFIRYGIETYNLTSSRAQTVTDSRFIVERLNRELGEALPNSIRISENSCDQNGEWCACVEFTPVAASGRYLWSMPKPLDNWLMLTPPWHIKPVGDFRLTTGISNPTELYQSSAPIDEISRWSDITNLILGPPEWANLDPTAGATCDLNAREDCLFFAELDPIPDLASPADRYYIINSPVSYCAVGSELRRYSDYKYLETQPVPGSFPSSASSVLMAKGLSATNGSSVFPFSIQQGTFRRTEVLRYQLAFTSSLGEVIPFMHEVHLENAR